MAGTTLRNPPLEVLIGNLRETVGEIHKMGALVAAVEEKIKPDAGKFWWKGQNGRPIKVNDINSISSIALGRPPNAIAFAGRTGDNRAVEIIARAARMFAQASTMFDSSPRSTGRYKGSVRFQLNGRDMSLAAMLAIQESNPLKPAETASMIVATEYASTLESLLVRRRMMGIVQRIGSALIAQYGGVASVATGYASGQEIGEAWKYATPIITAGGRGAFASTIARPGVNHRRRKRKAAKAAKAAKGK